jgi:serine/threonine-protein kinase
MAYELVRGSDLESLISSDAPLPLRRASRLGAGMLNALAQAHRKGVLHGDLKPAKVLVGAGTVAKVVDFGLARAFEERDGCESYLDPRYASPEQARGGPTGEASDQYAAAVIIYKMLTGKLPFSSKTPRGFWELHAGKGRPTSIARHRPDLPAPMVEAIMRALSKDVRARFPHVSDFERALAPFARRKAPQR